MTQQRAQSQKRMGHHASMKNSVVAVAPPSVAVAPPLVVALLCPTVGHLLLVVPSPRTVHLIVSSSPTLLLTSSSQVIIIIIKTQSCVSEKLCCFAGHVRVERTFEVTE